MTRLEQITRSQPCVAWHPGGQMFANIDKEYPAGWYIYNGLDTEPTYTTVSIDAFLITPKE